MAKFKVEKDEFGDVKRYTLTEYIYIEREVANNFTRTTSKYYLYSYGELIMESGIGTGYSLADLKREAKNILEDIELDEAIEMGFRENSFCDNYGYCCGSTCKNYSNCGGM